MWLAYLLLCDLAFSPVLQLASASAPVRLLFSCAKIQERQGLLPTQTGAAEVCTQTKKLGSTPVLQQQHRSTDITVISNVTNSSSTEWKQQGKKYF